MGDAAHPFLPTSQQGASQAVEDGVTIAQCLVLAKERDQPSSFALKAYQSLRYERVKKAQQLGVDNREMWYVSTGSDREAVCPKNGMGG